MPPLLGQPIPRATPPTYIGHGSNPTVPFEDPHEFERRMREKPEQMNPGGVARSGLTPDSGNLGGMRWPFQAETYNQEFEYKKMVRFGGHRRTT